jgi:hypothetical protein
LLRRPNWSRELPKTLVIPRVMTLRTLADVRRLVEHHLPAAYREKPSWQHVAKELEKAARNGNAVEVSAALSMVLAMEGVECRPR